MNIIFSIFFLLFTAEFSQIDSPDRTTPDEVESIIHEFFDAMRSADGSSIESLITIDATLHTVISEHGETILRETPMSRFIESVSGTDPGTLDEQLTSLQIHMDEHLATAWMEYRFYNSGEFSHCGVNTMNLLRKSTGWKIFSIVDTRKRDEC